MDETLKQKIIIRIQELSKELEATINQREDLISQLRQLDKRMADISILIPELQELAETQNDSKEESDKKENN